MMGPKSTCQLGQKSGIVMLVWMNMLWIHGRILQERGIILPKTAEPLQRYCLECEVAVELRKTRYNKGG